MGEDSVLLQERGEPVLTESEDTSGFVVVPEKYGSVLITSSRHWLSAARKDFASVDSYVAELTPTDST